jgi:hypothetical protein
VTLLQETTELLQSDQRTLRLIAEETGLGFEWLSKLKQEKIGDPGVVKIQTLNAYLKRGRKRRSAA